MAHGMRIARERGLPDAVTVYLTASVMEEDCDGLCWQYILRELGLKPEFLAGDWRHGADPAVIEARLAEASRPGHGVRERGRRGVVQPACELGGQLFRRPALQVVLEHMGTSTSSSCAAWSRCSGRPHMSVQTQVRWTRSLDRL